MEATPPMSPETEQLLHLINQGNQAQETLFERLSRWTLKEVPVPDPNAPQQPEPTPVPTPVPAPEPPSDPEPTPAPPVSDTAPQPVVPPVSQPQPEPPQPVPTDPTPPELSTPIVPIPDKMPPSPEPFPATLKVIRIEPYRDSCRVFFDPASIPTGVRDIIGFPVVGGVLQHQGKASGGVQPHGPISLPIHNEQTGGWDFHESCYAGVELNGVADGDQYQFFGLSGLAPGSFDPHMDMSKMPPDADNCLPIALGQTFCDDVRIINGHGLATERPMALVQSAVVTLHSTGNHVTDALFFDGFDMMRDFTERTPDQRWIPEDPQGVKWLTSPQGDAVFVRQSDCRGFAGVRQHHDHLELYFKDGGREFQTWPVNGVPTPIEMGGNQYSHGIYIPAYSADISGGKIVEMSCRIPAHATDRRWPSLFWMGEGDALARNDWHNRANADGSEIVPFASGSGLALYVGHDFHELRQYADGHTVARVEGIETESARRATPFAFSATEPGHASWLNEQDNGMDWFHKFRFILSQTRMQVWEEGVKRVDMAFATPLPFTTVRWLIGWALYHSTLERSLAAAWSDPPVPGEQRYIEPEYAVRNVLSGFTLEHLDDICFRLLEVMP